MPLTIVLEAHQAKRHGPSQVTKSASELLEQSCPDIPRGVEVIASSFDRIDFQTQNVYPSGSSLVRSAIEAWGQHSHLVIRPDDFWFSILVQMNFYMTRHAESLRHLFVSHTGSEQLIVSGDSWREILDGFDQKLKDTIKAVWLSDWVRPGFTTSTAEDDRSAVVLMMGMMKNYFRYAGDLICGIPSITLLGTNSDWQRLLEKIDRLRDFGPEPEDYARRLRPILSRIIRTFEHPNDAGTKEFWGQMVQAKIRHHHACGDPPKQYIVSGWVLALFYWNASGWPDRKLAEGLRHGTSYKHGPGPNFALDDVRYGEAALEDLPSAYAKAKFTMSSAGPAGRPFDGWVLAGNIGKKITSGGPSSHHWAIGERREPFDKPFLVPKGSDQAQSKRDRKTRVHEADAGCLSGVLRRLSCFPRRNPSQRISSQPNEKATESLDKAEIQMDEKKQPDPGQSTIQPLSGWFLFGPQKEKDPFRDEEEEECYGPTVDALESCDGVEHVRRAA